MNTILNISAFLRVARLGSFSAAAREMEAATSVIAKRISQLEKEVRARLITRTTRGVSLTAAGERFVPQFVRLIAAYDEAFHGHDTPGGNRRVEGFVRIISPPIVTSMFLGPIFTKFQLEHPGVDMDIVLMERSVNPLEEGFDLAVGGWPISYPDVVDVPICRYDLMTVCAPKYLQGKETPRRPRHCHPASHAGGRRRAGWYASAAARRFSCNTLLAEASGAANEDASPRGERTGPVSERKHPGQRPRIAFVCLAKAIDDVWRLLRARRARQDRGMGIVT